MPGQTASQADVGIRDKKTSVKLEVVCQSRMVQAAHCPLVCVRNAKNAGNIHPGSRPFARLLLIGRDLLARPMRLEQSEGECGTAGQTFLALRSRTARWRPSNNMAVCSELCESVVFCFA